MLEEFLDAVDGIAYAVDAEHRIVAVGRRRWDRFAVENGVPELCADSVIGRDLFEFVSGPDVRLAYRQMADRVISTGEPAVVNTRCDSPGVAPTLRLSISPLQLGDNAARAAVSGPDRQRGRRGRVSMLSISRPC